MDADFIPVNVPLLDGNEAKYLAECVETGWISSEGPFVKRLEQDFAARVGMAHGVAVTNGTAALEAACAALGLGPGDEVVLPSFTIISCAQAVVKTGATPVVVDCDPDTWNMDPEPAAAAVTPRTRAIMPVHMYGLPCDMDPILDLAKAHGLAVIEDTAQAIGLTYDGRDGTRPCGSMGTLSTFSFYPNKHVTTGEGGLIATNDAALAERCRSLRNLCFMPGKRFVHEELGWNLRMTNLQAAVGVAQLERLDAHLAMKRAMGLCYRELLEDLPGVTFQAVKTPYAANHWWVFGMVLDEGHPLDAAKVMAALAERGVGARPFFWPMHEQPVFRKMGLFEGLRLPVSEALARRGFYVPSGLALTRPQQELVARALFEVLGG